MVVTPHDFLVQAKRLVSPQNHPSEIDCRSGVSRAYYSLFHEACNVLELRGLYARPKEELGGLYARPKDKPHQEVKNLLLRFYGQMGLDYDSYRDDRVKADYNLTSTFYNQIDSEIKVNDMEDLIRRVKTL